MQRLAPWIPALLAGLLPAQQALVVPASAELGHENSRTPAVGTVRPARELTVIAPGQLTGLVGRTIHALVLRRDENLSEAQAGSLRITVRLSSAPHGPLDAVPMFGSNHGPDLTTVFSGDLPLPQVVGGSNQPTWTAADTVRIPFATPFPYAGGPLAVDLSAEPTPGFSNGYWHVDSVLDPVTGSVQDIGTGCGAFGGAQSRWLRITPESLVIGENPSVSAFGTPGGLALHVLSITPLPNAMTLSTLNGQPCFAHVSSWFFQEFRSFEAQPFPFGEVGGIASTSLQIPNQTNLMGASFTSQWVDVFQGLATSNAVQCTIAAQAPGIGMARVSADWTATGEPTEGLVDPRRGTVMRFEHQ